MFIDTSGLSFFKPHGFTKLLIVDLSVLILIALFYDLLDGVYGGRGDVGRDKYLFHLLR